MLIDSHTSSRKPGTKDSLDFVPTPPWGTRALCERIDLRATDIVLEPACGKLDMVRALQEYSDSVIYSDVHDYGVGAAVRDFNKTSYSDDIDWFITNPPFRHALAFILKALTIAKRGVAVLIRTNALEGVTRYNELWQATPPTRILQYVERLPMFAGRLDPDGSTKTAYMWVVWEAVPGGAYPIWKEPQPLEWIAPCRKRLERSSDYDQYSNQMRLT